MSGDRGTRDAEDGEAGGLSEAVESDSDASSRGLRLVGYDLVLRSSSLSTLLSILRQLCPRCRSATIFRSSIYGGFPNMHDRCPVCGLHFNREPGYFLGAMYISYGLALGVIVGIGAIFWALTEWSLVKVGIWSVLLFLPLTPMLTYLSRVFWIYLDQTLDPEG